MANSNPNRGVGFFFSNHDRRRDYSSPNEYRMKIETPFFSGNINIEFFLDKAYKVEKLFDLSYVHKRSMSSS